MLLLMKRATINRWCHKTEALPPVLHRQKEIKRSKIKQRSNNNKVLLPMMKTKMDLMNMVMTMTMTMTNLWRNNTAREKTQHSLLCFLKLYISITTTY